MQKDLIHLNWYVCAIQIFHALGLVNFDFTLIIFVGTLLTSCRYIGLKISLAFPFSNSWLRDCVVLTCVNSLPVANGVITFHCKSESDSVSAIYKLFTGNTCTQQTLAHPSNMSLENPSNVDNFSKLSKRQIFLTITGRGNAIKNTQYLGTNIKNLNGKLFYI